MKWETDKQAQRDIKTQKYTDRQRGIRTLDVQRDRQTDWERKKYRGK